MKKFLCLILVFIIGLGFTGCYSKTNNDNQSITLVDEVIDKYDNILQQTYYNEETDEYIIKKFIYELQQDKWVCVDQQTIMYSAKVPKTEHKCTKPTMSIYHNNNLIDSPITIMDNEYAKISIVKYLAADRWWEFGYEIKVYNKTNKVLSIIIDDCYIMNIQCKPLFSIDHIEAGKTAYFKLAWDNDTLTRCHIPYIDNVEFMVRVFDNEDWTVPALAGNRIMIKR